MSVWLDIQERRINLAKENEVALVAAFLSEFGLSFEGDVEFTTSLFSEEKMVATGSLSGKVIRNVAVSSAFQGEGLLATLMSKLMQEQASRGRYHYFVFTKPDKVKLFAGIGFEEVARVEPYAALLETGIYSITKYCEDLRQQTASLPLKGRAALVVNCNPFTLGHREVIARAAAENEAVIVFVVTADLSLFPFDVRIRLIREGTADLKNVAVVAGGDYIISSATFPGYFTRGEETVQAQTRLDATVFGQRIAPALGIVKRYVGEEPYCQVTAAYNAALQEILPAFGVGVKVIPRLAVKDEVISASKVRELIRLGDWDSIEKLVPQTTLAYLRSQDAKQVIDRICGSSSRH